MAIFNCEYFGSDNGGKDYGCVRPATYRITNKKNSNNFRFSCKKHKAATLKQFQNPKIERV